MTAIAPTPGHAAAPVDSPVECRHEQGIQRTAYSRPGGRVPGGHIDASVRTGDNRMLLTSLGLVHELTPETFATVTFDGEVVDGQLDASTQEMVGMHGAVYRSRVATQSVLHTHSPHLTAFALANQPLACRYEGLLVFGSSPMAAAKFLVTLEEAAAAEPRPLSPETLADG